MTCELVAIGFDAHAPARLAEFWSGVLGWARLGEELILSRGSGFGIRFLHSGEQKAGPNQVHFDVTSSSVEDQQATVDRALALGGRHLDLGLGADEKHIVLADPEDNEFCVIEAGNSFLANTATIGALSCEGSKAGPAQRVGRNRLRFELVASDVDAEVERLTSLGATRLEDGLLADLDGNEFSVHAG